jgi:dephospho-CoA kinase
MTKIIGLTGGIGSGKSTAAKEFENLGIPVYYADDEAKKIAATPEVQYQLIARFGPTICEHDQVINSKLAALVFADQAKLQQLNSIIHPLVKTHFEKWVQAHVNFPLLVKEAAILFESGSAANCDYVVSVLAPKEERIHRVMARDQVTEAQVIHRMQHQWTDEMRAEKSDFIITNIHRDSLPNQLKSIVESIQNSTKN